MGSSTTHAKIFPFRGSLPQQARALENDRRPDCTARVRGGGLSLLSITNFLIAGKRVLQIGKAHQLAPKENRSVIAVFTYC